MAQGDPPAKQWADSNGNVVAEIRYGISSDTLIIEQIGGSDIDFAQSNLSNISSVVTTGQSSVYAYLSTDQSLTAGTDEPVAFDAEVHDNLGEFDPATGSFTPSESGLYSIEGQISLAGVNDNDKIQFGFGTGFDTKEVISKREGATLGDFSNFTTAISADAFPLDSSNSYQFFVRNNDTDCSVQGIQRLSWLSISRSHLAEP